MNENTKAALLEFIESVRAFVEYDGIPNSKEVGDVIYTSESLSRCIVKDETIP